MKIVLASNNKGKLAELQSMLEPLGVELIPQGQLFTGEAEEPYNTFVENALTKARFASEKTGLPAIADDSGLCVDALNGAPGVFSARWAGEHGDDAANNDKLEAAMADVPEAERTARFHSSVVFVGRDEDGEEVLFGNGDCEGRIGFERRGDNGFGYDPLFLPDDTPGKTMAELTLEEKNAISHRFHALEDLAKKLA